MNVYTQQQPKRGCEYGTVVSYMFIGGDVEE